MNIKFSDMDNFKLSLASKIGHRGSNADFVSIEKNKIKTISKKTFPLMMYTSLDNEISDEIFSFYSLNTFLSIIENDDSYDMELNLKKYNCKIKSKNKKYNLPVLQVNEYTDFTELDVDQQSNPIYINTAIQSNEGIVDMIKNLNDNYIYKFKMSMEKISELMRDSRRIKGNVLIIEKNEENVTLTLSSKLNDDTKTTVKYHIEGEAKGTDVVNIPFFSNIMNGDMTFYINKEETLIVDTTNSIFFLTNSIGDIESENNITTDFDEEEFIL